MRMKRAAVVALCIAATGIACDRGNDDPPQSPAAPTSPGAVLPAVSALPSMCEGIGELPAEGEVTFARGDLLFGASAEGRDVRCITGVAGINPVFWGPQGEVLLDTGFTLTEVISESGRATISGPGKSPRFHGFSRPEGTNALYTAIDGSKLAEVGVEGGRQKDISFLRRHDEGAYHPSGSQLAVTGENEKGVYGVWLVASDGTGAHLAVPTRDEDEFYGATFSSDGATLYYVDDQHTFFELRSVDLSTLQEGIALPKSTLVKKEKLPISVTPSPFTTDLLTYRLGTCEDGFDTFIREGSEIREVAGRLRDTQPIGWLPDDRLVVAATDDLCDQERVLDLYVVDGESVELLVQEVTLAAVRAALPDAAPAPVSGPTGPAEG